MFGRGGVQDRGAQPVTILMTELERRQFLGMRVEELKAKHPEENDYQRAEKLQASFVKSGVSQASAESLRKLFPAARRAFREWMVRRGRV